LWPSVKGTLVRHQQATPDNSTSASGNLLGRPPRQLEELPARQPPTRSLHWRSGSCSEFDQAALGAIEPDGRAFIIEFQEVAAGARADGSRCSAGQRLRSHFLHWRAAMQASSKTVKDVMMVFRLLILTCWISFWFTKDHIITEAA